VAAVVPAVDECTDLDHQLADRGEGATVDDLAFNDPEPDLDEVEPRPRGRGEVDVDAQVRRHGEQGITGDVPVATTASLSTGT
jgi:hypothetical protein